MVMKIRLALLLSLAAGAACSSVATPTPGPSAGGDSTIAASDTVGVWQTNAAGTQFLFQQPRLRFVTTSPSEPYTINVDETRQYQSIVGFGAAFTDASTYLIEEKMTADQRHALLMDLFSPTEGLGLGFMRMTMGSSDFSRTDWSYDDVPRGQTDPTLAHFSIDRDREAMLPVIKEAREINPGLALMASPWSAPGWMKTTGSMIKGRLLPEAYDPYAHYFLRFLQAYAAEGVPVQYLSVQNEPDFEPENYPGMRMSAQERAAFVGQHLGPLLRGSGIGTQILEWDHNWDEPQQPLGFLADSVGRSFVTGVAWHCYAGNVSAQSAVHDAYPQKDAFLTECSGGEWSPDFGKNLAYFVGTLIIDGTRNWARGGGLLEPRTRPRPRAAHRRLRRLSRRRDHRSGQRSRHPKRRVLRARARQQVRAPRRPPHRLGQRRRGAEERRIPESRRFHCPHRPQRRRRRARLRRPHRVPLLRLHPPRRRGRHLPLERAGIGRAKFEVQSGTGPSSPPGGEGPRTTHSTS